jgi:type III pantothenate kinase
VDIRRPEKVVGKTTTQSIQSGLYFGYLSLVDGLIDRISKELEVRPRVIATGGLAELFGSGSERIEAVDPLLTLTGLLLIHDRNRGG